MVTVPFKPRYTIFLSILVVLFITLFLLNYHFNRNNSLKSTIDTAQPVNQTITPIQDTTYPNSYATTSALDCVAEIPLELIDDSTLNLDGTVTLYWFDAETQQQITKIFPFDPKSNFSGCSPSVQAKLREINEVAKELYGNEYDSLFMN